MTTSSLAGKPAPESILTDIPALLAAYKVAPDTSTPAGLVSFGTSGHRGTSFDGSFTDGHIAAITQAICEYRECVGITGPLFLGKDTHALSYPAHDTAICVLIANGVTVRYQKEGGVTATPIISRSILRHNANLQGDGGKADGIVITPSHNPPQDGGFKYNPPHGGPAETAVTGWIEQRANELLRSGGVGIKRVTLEVALQSPLAVAEDMIHAYVAELSSVVSIDRIRSAGITLGVDPMGGASLPVWQEIARHWGLNLTVVNTSVDPTFRFMSVDHDGKIRMDCSSRYAMAPLLALRNTYQIAFGNDPDSDRHGIVTPKHGLLDPNHYLAVCIEYLFRHRPGWAATARVGKTLVSSMMIDRVAAAVGRDVYEVPVGFKWFVAGLFDGSLGFGGEESAGASFLTFDGRPWSTDKDGIILNLLAAEMLAVTGKDPGMLFEEISQRHGKTWYRRVDQPCTAEIKAGFKKLDAGRFVGQVIGGDIVVKAYGKAPGNQESIGGVKVETERGWFAARPSGTENIYKIYAESAVSEEHLARIQEEARELIAQLIG